MTAVAEGTPLCLDCVHYDSFFAMQCIRGRRQIGVNPVTGNAEYAYDVNNHAPHERESRWFGFGRNCGPAGRHFKAR